MISDFYWPFLGGVEQHVRTLSHALRRRGHSVSVATLWRVGLETDNQDIVLPEGAEQNGVVGLAQSTGHPGDVHADHRLAAYQDTIPVERDDSDLPWHVGHGPELEHGVHVYRLRSSTQRAPWLFSDPKRPWAPPGPDPEIVLGLRRVIQRERPHLVHGHDWLARSFLPLKHWSGAKAVMSLHYYTLSCAKKNLMWRDTPCNGPGIAKCLGCGMRHYGALKGAATVLANWGMSVAERAAVDMFISVSRATAEGNGLHKPRQHIGRGMWATPRQVVIPNFVPAPPQPHPSSLIPHPSKELASYLAQLPQTPFLLFVGDLRPIKGIDVLLEAYAGLENAPPLVLIGKSWLDTPVCIRLGDARDTSLPANISVFYDWPNEAVRAAWERSLIGLAPSRWREPFGIVIIEAMAGGSPVIASRVGGIPEIVIDGETGFLIPPGDPAALRAALARLIHDPALCRTMGAAARQRAAAFTADSVVGRIEAVYREILQP